MYGIMSDIHFHDWSNFSSVNENGINTRLQETIDAANEACEKLRELGGSRMYLAGDLFHVRGSLKPSVMNPVIDFFKSQEEIEFFSIPGNHDLETNDTTRIGDALGALESLPNFTVAREPSYFGNEVMIPWTPKIDDLMKTLKEFASPYGTAIIHAPLNGVIMNIPDHGLSAEKLGELGYKAIFCGHYHNAKKFDNNVISVGALTHQTFSDVKAVAGFWIVDGESRLHMKTSAPKFVDVIDEYDEDAIKNNYVRLKINQAMKESEIQEIREELMQHARGAVIQAKPEQIISRPGTSSNNEVKTLSEHVAGWISDQKIKDPNVLKEALDVLTELEGVS